MRRGALAVASANASGAAKAIYTRGSDIRIDSTAPGPAGAMTAEPAS